MENCKTGYPKRWKLLLPGLLLAVAWMFARPPVFVSAKPALPDSEPPGPDRYTSITIEVTLNEWWLTAWEDNEVHCQLLVEHDGLPTPGEVYDTCGEKLYAQWWGNSPSCDQEDPTVCKGYYLQLIGTQTAEKVVPVTLPEPTVWISIENCETDINGWCITQPVLVLTGEEPLPNESILSLSGFAGEDSFTCEGNRCEFLLAKSDESGIRLTFWGASSYGDTSRVYEAVVQVLEANEDSDLIPKWYVSVLSSQWTGVPAASCAVFWEAFPPPEGLPDWLNTPDSSEELQSKIPYVYLAGNLIAQGAVDASACADNGLLPDGAASPCGLEAARDEVDLWQNRFDVLILQVAHQSDVPAQLLKNLFSRESQFWPGVFRESEDVGLGQITDNGADTALLWNPTFYNEFCPLVLEQSVCSQYGYAKLKPAYQAILRGALVSNVDATCETCPLGIDISKADFSVALFGRTLLANCEQAGKILQNVTGDPAGVNVSYEDMWRLTLVNYNAGPGCLGEAVETAYATRTDLTWENISAQLEPGCQLSIDYVNDITK